LFARRPAIPFRSKRQWRWAWASGAPFARRWARATPGGKERRYRRLPETKAEDAQATGAKPATPANTGTPGKLTRSEAARLGALARWGKYKAKPKPKGKGRKPAKTAEQKEAERRQKAQENRTATLADLDVSEEAQTAMEALAMGSVPDDAGGAELEAMGLAERDKSGALRLTSAGRATYNAASAGDKGRTKEALSRGRDATITAKEKEKAKADAEAEAAEEEKKPKGGGGGGGKPTPSEDEKRKAKAEERARTAAATAETVGLAKPALEALQAAAVGEGADGLTTDQGRRALTALERGDVRQYRAALQDAQARMGREAAAQARQAEKEKRDAEREQARAEQERERAARDAEREAARASRKRRMDRREALRVLGETQKAMDYTAIYDDLAALAAELAPEAAEVKAGRRNSASDQALINAICEAAADICEMAVALGARMPEMDDEDEDEMPEPMGGEVEVKAEDLPPAELETVYGGEIKAIDASDRIGGYAVLFGDADHADLSPHRDYFTKSTEFWLDQFGWPRPMTYHHGQHEVDDLRAAPVVGRWTKATVDEVGVFLEGELDRAHKYYRAVKELANRGLLKLSSDSAPQWVVRERKPNGAHEVKRWPLITASPTVSPAEPRLAGVSFKALLAELGLDAIDSPEATDPDPVETAPASAVKAATDPERERLVELELIEIATLEATWTT
jgi:hypothetical protein